MDAAAAGVKDRVRSHWLFAIVIAAFVVLSHAAFFRLPYYWDELGQFIPAALDIFQHGAWIPRSTVPNVHPPAVMAYLAGVWSLTGYSIAATRVAMLILAAAGAVITVRLGIVMGLPSGAAILATAWLSISPLFFAQSMMAQLDMPAMVFFSLALLLFLEDQIVAAALASTALVLTKETGLVLPAMLAAWLWFEGRRREALWFLLPFPPLLIWLMALDRSTGHLFGNAAFTQYNVWYPLHPVRLGLALVRRLYYLFLGSGHWIGTIALLLALRNTKLFRIRAWRIAGSLIAVHVVFVSILGGAVLERYLVPVLPLLYIGFAAAMWQYTALWRMMTAGALAAALIAANFINPPYPFPMENNLAYTDFVRLHVDAAQYLEAHFPQATISTMFPLSSALRRPEFGYVQRSFHIREVYDFRAANIAPLARENVEVVVLYSVAWDPWGLMQNKRWTAFLQRFYEYEPPVDAAQMGVLLNAHSVARWTRHGQWIEIYQR